MNYVDELIKQRNLPPLMSGIESQEGFIKKQKEIRRLLAEKQYGVIPPKPEHMSVEITDEDERFCAGSVVLRRLKLNFEHEGNSFSFVATSAIPKSDKPVPAFLHINFWSPVPNKYMPTEEICDGGFAVFSFCHADVTSDDGDFKNGCAKYLVKSRRNANASGKLAIWAWAAMRVMDYIETLSEIDSTKVTVVGHSRLGKTALLASAYDDRFMCAISNDSGCCGAAIERKKAGETYKRIAEVFPFWFCPSFIKNALAEKEMPFDQHYLLALSVPRHIIIGSAEEDLWADPTSEFLCLASVNEAYRLFNKRGLVHNDVIPTPNTVLSEGDTAYHIRTGTHYFSRRDWVAYMDIVRKWL